MRTCFQPWNVDINSVIHSMTMYTKSDWRFFPGIVAISTFENFVKSLDACTVDMF